MANGCLAYRSSTAGNFPLSSASFATPIPWDTEAYDDDSWHDPSDPSKFVVPVGVTRVRVVWNFAVGDLDDNTVINANIALNGNTAWQYRGCETLIKLAEAAQQPRASIVIGGAPVSSGDVIQCFASAAGDSSFYMDRVRSSFFIEDAS